MNPLRFAAALFCLLSSCVYAAPALDATTEAALGIEGNGVQGTSSTDPRAQWFEEAKYGLFVHWGIYSIPAGEWNGQKIGLGEWVMNKGKITIPEYTKLAEQFNPTKFDAEEWAQMAQDAGMKYIVITSKHHDGFAMFHSKATPYNVYDATSWKHDPMKELQEACARHGLKLCFYYSHAADWHEPNGGGGNNLDFAADRVINFDEYMDGKVIPQIKELLTNYGPVGLLWFDWPGPFMSPERCKKLADVIHAIQPQTLINSRLGPKPSMFKDFKGCYWDYRERGDNETPPVVTPGLWETAATINHSWGYRAFDREVARPADDILFALVDVTSKGGNYLLNVGPDSTGVIPPVSQQNLRQVGAWLKVNGEAVYGTGPTPFGAELGDFVAGGKPDKNGKLPFDQKKEWRCTTRPGKLFIHLFKWPQDSFILGGVKQKIAHAYLLADKNSPLKVTQTGEQLQVALPSKQPDPMDSVLVLEY